MDDYSEVREKVGRIAVGKLRSSPARRGGRLDALVSYDD
jgi:hypothetical protein